MDNRQLNSHDNDADEVFDGVIVIPEKKAEIKKEESERKSPIKEGLIDVEYTTLDQRQEQLRKEYKENLERKGMMR